MALLLNITPAKHRPIFGRAVVHCLVQRASELTRIPVAELLSPSRQRDTTYTRFAIMKVARERGRALQPLGKSLGSMNHTSVMYGLRRAEVLEREDAEFAQLVDLLRQEIEG